ncbi:hypothetical protein GCM10027155_20270 [Acinetobacter apis]|uniref:Uncharacterized protein n=1 Tax=Acinetobacter apis TaxID=1229165 RepID=A0A217EI36_9GAMM|nr:hypothetical protein [Acinetobacter apis]SNQ30143.1 hypothetical protein SAMN05444584_2130 [Acinetobacter apis]
MPKKLNQYKWLIMISALCMMMLSSITATLAYTDALSDSLLISTSVLLGTTLFFTLAYCVIEKINDICNP